MRGSPIWLRVSLLILVLLTPMAGLPLHNLFGARFFNAYSSYPQVVVPVLMVLTGLLVSSSRFQDQARHRFPTGWVRALFSLVSMLLLAGILYVCGSGWVAATSRLLAREPATVELEVLNLYRDESRRSRCSQELVLAYRDSKSRLCTDHLLPRAELRVGTKLQADGLVSPLGFHLQALRQK